MPIQQLMLMKCVRTIGKPASIIMKEYSKLLTILYSWKYASSLSYFRRVYQQRKDCVLESLSKELKKELKYGIGRKVL